MPIATANRTELFIFHIRVVFISWQLFPVIVAYVLFHCDDAIIEVAAVAIKHLTWSRVFVHNTEAWLVLPTGHNALHQR